MFWVYVGDNWYTKRRGYDGPWELVEPVAVPLYILRVSAVRYYRQPPPYFRDLGRGAPRRTGGEHWGRSWEERRRGIGIAGTRSAVPPPAPLPTYQQRYSGNRYPHIDQQQVLQNQKLSLPSPMTSVAQQYYQRLHASAQSGRGQAAGRRRKGSLRKPTPPQPSATLAKNSRSSSRPRAGSALPTGRPSSVRLNRPQRSQQQAQQLQAEQAQRSQQQGAAASGRNRLSAPNGRRKQRPGRAGSALPTAGPASVRPSRLSVPKQQAQQLQAEQASAFPTAGAATSGRAGPAFPNRQGAATSGRAGLSGFQQPGAANVRPSRPKGRATAGASKRQAGGRTQRRRNKQAQQRQGGGRLSAPNSRRKQRQAEQAQGAQQQAQQTSGGAGSALPTAGAATSGRGRPKGAQTAGAATSGRAGSAFPTAGAANVRPEQGANARNRRRSNSSADSNSHKARGEEPKEQGGGLANSELLLRLER